MREWMLKVTRSALSHLGYLSMWSFEQPHGAINIVVNIRMTVIRLEGGGLWVHAPIAPTEECVALVRELVARWGPHAPPLHEWVMRPLPCC